MKASPGKYKFASSGIGASPHLTMEYFMAVAGINLIHVPYKNSSQGYTDTMSGEIQAFFFNLPGPLPFVKSGRLRALAVTSAKRAPQVPGCADDHGIWHSWILSLLSGRAMQCPKALHNPSLRKFTRR